MESATIVGLAAAVLSSLSMTPQVIKIKNRGVVG